MTTEDIYNKIKTKLLQHSKEEYPKECCGLAVVIMGKFNIRNARI